jgi:hypothetical protein
MPTESYGNFGLSVALLGMGGERRGHGEDGVHFEFRQDTECRECGSTGAAGRWRGVITRASQTGADPAKAPGRPVCANRRGSRQSTFSASSRQRRQGSDQASKLSGGQTFGTS